MRGDCSDLAQGEVKKQKKEPGAAEVKVKPPEVSERTRTRVDSKSTNSCLSKNPGFRQDEDFSGSWSTCVTCLLKDAGDRLE